MPKILVIDDDKLVGETVQILLRTRGYDVTVVQDGESAMEAVKTTRFDLAIVDLFMPNMNGLKLIEAIRAIDPRLPSIVASGFMLGGQCREMPGFDAMAAEVGALATLYKPLRPNDVLQAVAGAIAGEVRPA